jgi:hypothetical protein
LHEVKISPKVHPVTSINQSINQYIHFVSICENVCLFSEFVLKEREKRKRVKLFEIRQVEEDPTTDRILSSLKSNL